MVKEYFRGRVGSVQGTARRAAAAGSNRLDQGSAVAGLAVGWSGGDGSGLQWGQRHWETGQWTAQGSGESRAQHG